MALVKNKTTLSGTEADYWRIVQLNCNYDRLDAACTVALYISEEMRAAGMNSVDSFKIDLASQFHDGNYQDGDDVMKNISLKEAYKALKAMAVAEDAKLEEWEKQTELAFFADAVDV